MAKVKFEVDFDEEFIRKIEASFAILESRNFRRLMNRIGGIVKSNTVERFNRGIEPDGSPWPDNNRPNNILVDTGALKGSIKFELENDFTVEIGSDLIYAATHQFGDPSRNIKKREFLGISREDERDILEEIDAFLKKEIG